MKTIIKIVAILSISLFFGFRTPSAGSLIIEVENIEIPEGVIWIGIYDSKETYLIKEKAIIEKIDVSKSGKSAIVIPQLPFGTYAVALFHDINNNGDLDRNLIGIPSEPYAFSKKTKLKWRLPKFDEIKFSFNSNNQHLNTNLEKWWE